jgi:hypothetical protein
MKPRLPVAELTEEDFAIMKRCSRRWWAMMAVIRPCLAPIYTGTDRRDADLMFYLMKPATSRWCFGCPAGPFACPVRCQRQIWEGHVWSGAEVRLV